MSPALLHVASPVASHTCTFTTFFSSMANGQAIRELLNSLLPIHHSSVQVCDATEDE